MKYEQQLKSRMIPSWHLYYMAYSQLKQLLKQKEEFENILGSELSKVCRFLRHQLDRINEQTHQLESNSSRSDNGTSNSNYNNKVTELVFDLHDTTQFLHANKTAFDKMVKKHDRYTSFSIQHRYKQLITASSLDTYTKQMDTLMVRLCYLYDLCREPQQQPDTVPEHAANDNSQQQQNYIAICLFHLSMLSSIYPSNSNPPTPTTQPQGDKDCSNNITSVYLDNSNFDLYKKHVELCNDYNTTFLGMNAEDLDDWNSNRMISGGNIHSSSSSSNNKTQKNQGTGLGENKTHTFPYGLLTIDHQVAPCAGNWLAQLLSSHLVYPVPRFSTFVHAISLFYSDQLALSFLSPWWLLSVPKDIRKSPCNHIGLSRTASARPLINGHRQASFEQLTAAAAATSSQHIAIPLMHPTVYDTTHSHTKEVEHDASPYCRAWWPLRLRQRRQPQQKNDHQQLKLYDKDAMLLTNQLPTTSITELSSTTIISKGKKKDIANNTNKGKKELNMNAAVKNNRMTEPKTYFANERTFITWLQFCAVLLTVALSLFNHGDWISRWMGAMFLFMTCLLACYSYDDQYLSSITFI
ncbi:hypothetical protein BCR42DRAFT_409635 [Absidia repens]|uniref:SPX domain-containing protein n=1 Tax=Absidia repens TaxID=90262 RepID=A0A1X2IMX1_9FUNG|nr:hypothetical protein BCR42DRAFT_409635 [Absidia repens]